MVVGERALFHQRVSTSLIQVKEVHHVRTKRPFITPLTFPSGAPSPGLKYGRCRPRPPAPTPLLCFSQTPCNTISYVTSGAGGAGRPALWSDGRDHRLLVPGAIQVAARPCHGARDYIHAIEPLLCELLTPILPSMSAAQCTRSYVARPPPPATIGL